MSHQLFWLKPKNYKNREGVLIPLTELNNKRLCDLLGFIQARKQRGPRPYNTHLFPTMFQGFYCFRWEEALLEEIARRFVQSNSRRKGQ